MYVCLPSTPSRAILAAMHKSIRPIGLALALLLITLIQPVNHPARHRLQSSDMALAAAAPKTPVQTAAIGYTYTVKPTDTLWDIAVAHGITVEAPIAANNMSDPRLLRPGQALFILAI
jgi:LysM repeat protein